jgi:GNAT superfamily N-acetyltransferase
VARLGGDAAAGARGGLQQLAPGHASAYLAHLLRLSKDDRRLRFAHPAHDKAVARAVARIDWETTALFGWVEGGVVRGVAHLAWPDAAWLEGGAEVAVSVETALQRQGVGRRLVDEAIAEARRRRLPVVHYVGLAENRALIALMAGFGGTAVRQGGEIAGRVDLPADSHLPGLSRRSRLERRSLGNGLSAAISRIDLTPNLG